MDVMAFLLNEMNWKTRGKILCFVRLCTIVHVLKTEAKKFCHLMFKQTKITQRNVQNMKQNSKRPKVQLTG